MTRLLLVLTLVGALRVSAQEPNASTHSAAPSRFGLFGNADFALSLGDFSGIPGISSCCPEYTSTSDLGFLAGVAYIGSIDDVLSFNLRLHYWSYSTPFKTTETEPIVDGNGNPATATIEHNLTGTFQQISVEPLLGYRLGGGLVGLGGLTIGTPFSATVSQKEVLVDPVDATFAGNSRERNVVNDASIPNASAIALGITLGLSYDLPLDADKTLFISPEVLFTYNVLPHSSDVSWNTHHIRAGLVLSFVPPAVDDSLTDVELFEFTKTVTPPTSISPGVPFVSSVTHSGLTETGNPADGSKIRIEEFASTRIRPLLPYIFFKPGTAELDPRYRRLREEQVESFAMANFYNLDAIVTYNHVLNIIGRRMTDDPSATITLTGCADPAEGTPDVAAKRAAVVKDYLTGTWGINEARITVTTRGLPERASRSSEPDGLAENARVEIASNAAILTPVESTDTMLVTTPSGLRFKPEIDPRVNIAGYTLFVAHDGNLLKTFAGGNPLPPGVDWRISESVPWIPKDAKEISYLVAVRDSSGVVVPSPTKTVPLERITSADKVRSGGQDIRVDRYSLILFGFDQDELSPDHKAQIAVIKDRIQPNSTVKVIGYTDRSGDAAYNQSLSERRARAVARALGLPESAASGRGETLPLYDNNTPEGRFYSRTVEVLVETPRK